MSYVQRSQLVARNKFDHHGLLLALVVTAIVGCRAQHTVLTTALCVLLAAVRAQVDKARTLRLQLCASDELLLREYRVNDGLG